MKTTVQPTITIDQNSGFCFGVVYAIEMAEDILQKDNYLYCLGDIVHNDEEVDRLKNLGLRIIDHHDLHNLKGEKVLIRAHGEPPSTYRIALENNLTLIDASCPVVLKLQNRIKNAYDKDENIYIYGKEGHAEVIGLKGQTNNNAIVIQSLSDESLNNLPEAITLFSQTTKSTEGFYDLKSYLENKGVKVKANDTICRQVANRNKELHQFAAKFDIILFVSGTKSSNGKVLFQVCKSVNENTYFITKPDDLDSLTFTNDKSIGICGATSTPMWLMEKVKDKVTELII